MDKDIQWFLGFIGVFALLWIASGGINSDRTKRPFIRPLTEGGGIYGEDFLPGTVKSSQTIKQSKPTPDSISKDLEQAEKDAEKIRQDLANFAKYSPLKGKLTLSLGSSGYDGKPNSEQLTIYASYQNTEPIQLTGLTLKSTASGAKVTIGKGVQLIMPGTSMGKEPIFLPPGGTAYISSGRSPIAYSFRTNKCAGYFEKENDFMPSLSMQCPRLEDEPMPVQPNQFSNTCLDYIDTLQSCSAPTTFPLWLDGYCQRWIVEEANYNRCVTRHKTDANFYSNEWRIYLEQDQQLWRTRREHIELLDSTGKIISDISIN